MMEHRIRMECIALRSLAASNTLVATLKAYPNTLTDETALSMVVPHGLRSEYVIGKEYTVTVEPIRMTEEEKKAFEAGAGRPIESFAPRESAVR